MNKIEVQKNSKMLFKSLLIIILFGLSISCNDNEGRDNCIRNYMDEEGYSFDEAKEACDEVVMDPKGQP